MDGRLGGLRESEVGETERFFHADDLDDPFAREVAERFFMDGRLSSEIRSCQVRGDVGIVLGFASGHTAKVPQHVVDELREAATNGASFEELVHLFLQRIPVPQELDS